MNTAQLKNEATKTVRLIKAKTAFFLLMVVVMTGAFLAVTGFAIYTKKAMETDYIQQIAEKQRLYIADLETRNAQLVLEKGAVEVELSVAKGQLAKAIIPQGSVGEAFTAHVVDPTVRNWNHAVDSVVTFAKNVYP